MKLFNVTSIINDFPWRGRSYDNVTMHWWVESRNISPEYEYAALINGYDPRDDQSGYSEGAINEAFTEDEARQLAAYLNDDSDVSTTITEMSLPVSCNTAGWGCMAVGGGTDFCTLSKGDDYNLPFSVWGYFDMHDDAIRRNDEVLRVSEDYEHPASDQVSKYERDTPMDDYGKTCEVWITHTDDGPRILIVREDESVIDEFQQEQDGLESPTILGAAREITGIMIDGGYTPDGKWTDTRDLVAGEADWPSPPIEIMRDFKKA